MQRYTQFVWMMLYAQFFCCTAAWLSEAAAQHHHQGISSITQQGLIGSPDEGMPISKNKYRWCRRCLRIQDDEAPTPVAEDQAVVDPPMADLPTLPTDPESSTSKPPPAPRTNPSSLLTPSETPGPGVMSLGNNTKSGLAGKVGISAGVGATAGVAVLLLGVLYYFKPDIFLCCKTCVRVQIFHHSAANSKK